MAGSKHYIPQRICNIAIYGVIVVFLAARRMEPTKSISKEPLHKIVVFVQPKSLASHHQLPQSVEPIPLVSYGFPKGCDVSRWLRKFQNKRCQVVGKLMLAL